MRVRLTVIGGSRSVAERYDGAVIGRWQGKPVQLRRGPATVTGEVRRTRRSRGAGHWLASASREGAAWIGPEARRPAPTARPHRPSWKGVGHSCIAPARAARRSPSLALLAVAAIAAASAGAAAPAPTVTVRVEGHELDARSSRRA